MVSITISAIFGGLSPFFDSTPLKARICNFLIIETETFLIFELAKTVLDCMVLVFVMKPRKMKIRPANGLINPLWQYYTG